MTEVQVYDGDGRSHSHRDRWEFSIIEKPYYRLDQSSVNHQLVCTFGGMTIYSSLNLPLIKKQPRDELREAAIVIYESMSQDGHDDMLKKGDFEGDLNEFFKGYLA